MNVRKLKNILLEYEEILLSKVEKLKMVDFSKRYVEGAIKYNETVIHYETIRKRQFKKVFKAFCLETKGHNLMNIIDYGSGKGYMLYLLSKSRYFNIISGIEILPELCAICKMNLEKMGINEVRIINEDARNYTEIDQYNVIFMFNPFPELAMKEVVMRIAESLSRKPREICIIYVNNVYENILECEINQIKKKRTIDDLPRYGCTSAIYTNF